MNSSQKGDIGEAVILAEFAKRGYTVLIPFGNHAKYDLAVDNGTQILKVQCKTARMLGDVSGLKHAAKLA